MIKIKENQIKIIKRTSKIIENNPATALY